MFDQIKEQCTKVAKKHSHVRADVKQFMEEWAKATEGLDICIQLEAGKKWSRDFGCDAHHYLAAGENDLLTDAFDDCCVCVSARQRKNWFYDELSMNDIRKIVSELPSAIEKFSKRLEGSEKADDATLDILKKFILLED